MKYITQITVGAILLAAAQSVQSQPLQVDLIPNPSLSPDVQEWEADPTSLILNVVNNSPQELMAQVHITVFEGGNPVVQTNPGLPPIITIPAGPSSVQFTADQIAPGPAFQYVSIPQGSPLPPNLYDICADVIVFDPPSFPPTDPSCKPIIFEAITGPGREPGSISPVTLVTPVDGFQLTSAGDARLLFSWTPPIPAPQPPLAYNVFVFEVLSGQTPIQALQSNQAIVEEQVLQATQLLWPTYIELPQRGKSYVWTVQAADFNGNTLGPNDGFAETFTFGWKDDDPVVSEEPGSIVPTHPLGACDGNALTGFTTSPCEINWVTTQAFETFTVTIYENHCGTWTPPLTPPDEMPRPRQPVITQSGSIPGGGSGSYSHSFDCEDALQPGEAYIYQITGTTSSGSVSRSSAQCGRYAPPLLTYEKPPCEPPPVQCALVPELKGDPKMDGGLLPNESTHTIERDEYIPLVAEGADVDQFWWSCVPKPPCQETGSKEMTNLSSRVKFAWRIKSGEGNFVEIGCLPKKNATDGKRVIFEPPYVMIDSVKTTVVELKIIDDNGSQPADGVVTRDITIKTQRTLPDSTKYKIDITSPKWSLPLPVPITGLPKGTCLTVGPTWRQSKDLSTSNIKLPPVQDSDTLVFKEWILLRADDKRDSDLLIVSCQSECTPSLYARRYEDDVQWEWSVTKGNGRFVGGAFGREVIFEAFTIAEEVEIEVRVFNPSGLQIGDAVPPNGKIKLQVVQPGVELQEIPLTWVPQLDRNYELRGRLRHKKGDKWIRPLAHQCKVIYFDIDTFSNEPGVALNWDLAVGPRRENPDLRFREEENKTDFELGEAIDTLPKYYSLAVTKKKIVGSAVSKPNMRCEDWGAFGHIVIDAKGPYENIPDTGRHFPRDNNMNRIADGQAAWDAGGASGRQDRDNIPVGNGTRGDGYTNYEEYRGFYLRGAHTRTAITRKDIFIVDHAGRGIGSFAASGLTARMINRNEMDSARVVNYMNRTHHGGDQHGLRIVGVAPGGSVRGRAVGGPGFPRVVDSVMVDPAVTGAMLARVLAHELSHACNVRHHGEGRGSRRCYYNGTHCWRLRVVPAGGVTSGVSNCYMRYSWRNYHCNAVAPAGANVQNCNTPCTPTPGTARRVWGQADGVIGTILCNATGGTGVNAGGACGGNATRGRCQRQLQVKDW